MKTHSFRKWFLSLLVLFASACTCLCPRYPTLLSDRPDECQAFLERLDDEVQKAGVKDSSTYRVPHFPYLRSSRFLSALKEGLETDGERECWLLWMRELDLAGRRKEIRNLPDEAILALDSGHDEEPNREALYRRVESCSNALLSHDKIHPDFYESLYSFVDIPDEYSLLMRAAGLYPLASIPVTIVTARVKRKIKSRFDVNFQNLPTKGDIMTFAPPGHSLLQEGDIEEMMKQARANLLQVPRLDREKTRQLVAHFAPVFVQDVAASYDRFGSVKWDGECLAVELEDPTVYWYISHAFFEGMPAIQINYVIWYSRRSGKESPWIERGHLDGLTVRVSLDAEGRPLVVDAMNNCGCYHFFSPQKDRVAQVFSKRLRLDPFVPQWLPDVPCGQRLGIRVNTGWHQVERLVAIMAPIDAAPYDLLPYEVLETLPRDDGTSESMFDVHGIAKGSERVEPFILFSMGIPSVGSMRQRSHHAISLTGRNHFDEPFLFDRSFVFK